MGQERSGTVETAAFRIDYRRALGGLDMAVVCLRCRTGALPRTLQDLSDFADSHGPGECCGAGSDEARLS